MKLLLRIIVTLALISAIISGMSSAREWVVLNSLLGYQKELFTIEGTKVTHDADDATAWYLHGRGPQGPYEFAISSSRYQDFRWPSLVGRQITVYRNTTLPSLTFQQESVNVILEEDWRDRPLLEASARSTLALCVLSLIIAIIALVLQKFAFRSRLADAMNPQ